MKCYLLAIPKTSFKKGKDSMWYCGAVQYIGPLTYNLHGWIEDVDDAKMIPSKTMARKIIKDSKTHGDNESGYNYRIVPVSEVVARLL